MSLEDIYDTLIQYQTSGGLALPAGAFGGGPVEEALQTFLENGELDVATVTIALEPSYVSVTGMGANDPFDQLSLEAQFAPSADSVGVTLTATVTPSWTFGVAFPALSATFLGGASVSQGSLTLATAGGLALTGDLTVGIGGTPLGAGFFAARANGSVGYLAGFVLPVAWSPGQLWAPLQDLFSGLTLSDSGLIYSTIAAGAGDFPTLTMPSVPATIAPGVTFFTTLELGGSLSLLAALFGSDTTLELQGTIDTADPGQSDISASLPLSGGLGALEITGLTLDLQPANREFSLDASADLTIDGEIVQLAGGGSIQVEPPKATFSIQIESWRQPFGLSGLEIEEFGLAVTIEDAVTVSFLGTFDIGSGADAFTFTIGGELADFEVPSALVFSLTDSNPATPLTLGDLLTQFTSVPLENVPVLDDVAFTSLAFYLVADPSGSWTSPDGHIYPNGIGVDGELVFFSKWDLELAVTVGTSELKASGSIADPIALLDVLTISDATGGAKGPSIQIDTAAVTGGGPYFACDGAIRLMGLSESFHGSASDDGFALSFEASLASLFTAAFSASYSQEDSFTGSTSGSFDLDLPLPELDIDGVPIIPAVTIQGPSASLSIGASASPSAATVSVALSFTWGSFDMSPTFTLDATQVEGALANLWAQIVGWIDTNLQQFYQPVLADVQAFVDAIKNGVLALGQDAAYVAAALKQAFSAAASDVARYLSDLGYSISQTTAALVSVFEMGLDEAAQLVSQFAQACAVSFAQIFVGVGGGSSSTPLRPVRG